MSAVPRQTRHSQTVLDAIDLGRQVKDPRIQEAVAVLRKSDGPWDLRLIAARLNISSSYFRHLFKTEIGISPARYMRLVRFVKARELFQGSFLSVKEVMVILGFADPSHFVRDYKALFRQTPSQTKATASRSQ